LLAADVRHLHFRRAAGRTGAQLGVAVGADCPDGCDLLAQRLSLAPPRSAARRSCPDPANRQVQSIPSAESRARVQLRQNGWVTEATMPISPAPSR
jgi:hypothetical protein